MKRLSDSDLTELPIVKTPASGAAFTNLYGFLDEEKDLLGIVAMCNFDKDYNVVALARESKSHDFRAIDLATSFETKDLAEEALLAILAEWKHKNRSEIEAALK
jgi:hypothetical protein